MVADQEWHPRHDIGEPVYQSGSEHDIHGTTTSLKEFYIEAQKKPSDSTARRRTLKTNALD